MKKVIYTTIFGDYDDLLEPTFKPDGYDFVCFTDSDLKSDTWEIRKVLPLYNDPTRSAKKYKILPHRFLSEYDYSFFVDGNILVRENPDDIINQYLIDYNMAMFDHNKCEIYDRRNCVYQELQAILHLGQQNGKYKDNPQLMINQVQKYQKEGYPQNNGLVCCMIMSRKHNEPDVIQTMEDWWIEIKHHSRRDQLSFNYVAWKNNFNFVYMGNEDVRNNKWFKNMGPHKRK
tara:strand:+ start:44 stop:736 length:693 start_codon:yes stop_codon:yes gene_type:complete